MSDYTDPNTGQVYKDGRKDRTPEELANIVISTAKLGLDLRASDFTEFELPIVRAEAQTQGVKVV